MLNKDIDNMKSVAYYSGFGGIEIKKIEYGIEDHIICISGAWTGKHTSHNVKIYYTASGDPYFKINGCRIPLNECLRMDV